MFESKKKISSRQKIIKKIENNMKATSEHSSESQIDSLYITVDLRATGVDQRGKKRNKPTPKSNQSYHRDATPTMAHAWIMQSVVG